jgi:AcrR family transcriptional regulator
MDKREEKTIDGVYQGLQRLLSRKSFSELSVADIIQEAGISRSTFYAHFSSKDDVLDSVCQSIFDHVFSSSLNKEKDHDFSNSNVFDYAHYLTHIFCHFQEEKDLISLILLDKENTLFINKLKEEIRPLMKSIIGLNYDKFASYPEEMIVNQMVDSFSSLLRYWMGTSCADSPEKMTKTFIALNIK